MDFRQLTNFVKVLELKSLSRAAQQLGIGQPALGMQLRALEDELKQQLVMRHSRGIEPTEAGLVLLSHARGILLAVDDAREAVAQMGEPRGRVDVGMVRPASTLVLADLLRMGSQRHPQVTLNIIEDLSSALIAKVLSGEIEMALVYALEDIRGLVMKPLVSDYLYFVTSDRAFAGRDRIGLREVLELDLILPSGPSTIRSQLDSVASWRTSNMRPILEVKSDVLIKDLVAQGIGHTILPYNSVRLGVEKGSLLALRIEEPILPTTIYLVQRVNRSLTRAGYAVRTLTLEIIDTVVRASGVEIPDVTDADVIRIDRKSWRGEG